MIELTKPFLIFSILWFELSGLPISAVAQSQDSIKYEQAYEQDSSKTKLTSDSTQFFASITGGIGLSSSGDIGDANQYGILVYYRIVRSFLVCTGLSYKTLGTNTTISDGEGDNYFYDDEIHLKSIPLEFHYEPINGDFTMYVGIARDFTTTVNSHDTANWRQWYSDKSWSILFGAGYLGKLVTGLLEVSIPTTNGYINAYSFETPLTVQLLFGLRLFGIGSDGLTIGPRL